MRNKHPGYCYQCGNWVEVGAGHFNINKGKWRVHHFECAIKHREEKERLRFEKNVLSKKNKES
jgi:hypothetical protein